MEDEGEEWIQENGLLFGGKEGGGAPAEGTEEEGNGELVVACVHKAHCRGNAAEHGVSELGMRLQCTVYMASD